MESQYVNSINYLVDLNEELTRYFHKKSIHQLRTLKELAVDFIRSDLDSEQLKTYLTGSTIALLKKGKQQLPNETDEHYQKRIKYLSTQVAGLWQDDIRAKLGRISDITDSKDRIKKLIQILIAIDYSEAHNNLPKYSLPTYLLGDFKNSSSINSQLHTHCLQIAGTQLTELENYEPHFSASFTDKDFVHFVEQRAQQLDSTTYLHTKQINCIYSSIKHLDSFRIHTEILGRQDLKRSQNKYKEAVDEYNKYKKDLVKLKKTLAGTNNPKQAKIKELITQQGFTINAKTEAAILLSAKSQEVEKGIKRIIKTTEKQEFRSKDKQDEKNFLIYNFLDTEQNPCDFIEHKTVAINTLVNDFLTDKTATEVITSKKDLKYGKSRRQMSVRMPKSTVTAIQRLAKKNNISQRLLLNIIIQNSAEAIKSEGQNYYNKVLQNKRSSPNTPEAPSFVTEQSTPLLQPTGNTLINQPPINTGSPITSDQGKSSEPQKEELPVTKNPWRPFTKPQKKELPVTKNP